jgi:hypothetical protein
MSAVTVAEIETAWARAYGASRSRVSRLSRIVAVAMAAEYGCGSDWISVRHRALVGVRRILGPMLARSR